LIVNCFPLHIILKIICIFERTLAALVNTYESMIFMLVLE
jgi:hypothetical protein